MLTAVLLLLAHFLGAVKATVVFTNQDFNVLFRTPFSLQWTGNQDPVNITLLRESTDGKSANRNSKGVKPTNGNLKLEIVNSFSGSILTWIPPPDLATGLSYKFSIADGTSSDLSPIFVYRAQTSSVASPATSAETAATLPAPMQSSMTMPSQPMSASSVSPMPPAAAAPIYAQTTQSLQMSMPTSTEDMMNATGVMATTSSCSTSSTSIMRSLSTMMPGEGDSTKLSAGDKELISAVKAGIGASIGVAAIGIIILLGYFIRKQRMMSAFKGHGVILGASSSQSWLAGPSGSRSQTPVAEMSGQSPRELWDGDVRFFVRRMRVGCFQCVLYYYGWTLSTRQNRGKLLLGGI
ncbi:hypothetical protein B0T17DRAFT_502096 [Bombardia bombarda]|uniref:Uncharacterized protein n=1 Tax=Bombardia bombarda TaxID=252184 RepID=A0AA39XI49_9PEZI|nr:hypothetical protein B0T17DRAFT_502096 [Bombardia bombarda]